MFQKSQFIAILFLLFCSGIFAQSVLDSTNYKTIGNETEDEIIKHYGKDTARIIFEKYMLQEHNCIRAKNNVPPLVLNEKLCQAARKYVQVCRKRNSVEHNLRGTPTYRAQKEGYKSSFIGENNAWNYRTLAETVSAWVNSPTHFANIKNKNFSDFGVAYYDGYWVVMFGKSP